MLSFKNNKCCYCTMFKKQKNLYILITKCLTFTHDIKMSTLFLSVCLLFSKIVYSFLSVCLLYSKDGYTFLSECLRYSKDVYTFLSVCLLYSKIVYTFLSICLLYSKNVYTFFTHNSDFLFFP